MVHGERAPTDRHHLRLSFIDLAAFQVDNLVATGAKHWRVSCEADVLGEVSLGCW